ncbi:MAG: phenylacetate--CoA ligase family protein [Gammaproteobacteria bacterium]|nr:phenylacetate--CoA ligase family protein [Gammaproteobacteria bacterium]
MPGPDSMRKPGRAIRLAGKLIFLARSQWWDRATIRAWQRRHLISSLRYAVSSIPYYSALGIDPTSITDVHALQRFPLLTKDIIQEQADRLRNPAIDPATLQFSMTSGSSGQPTTTWFDENSWLLCKYALKIRRTLLGGWPFGQRLMIFGEQPADGRSDSAPTMHRGLTHREMRLSVFLPPDVQHSALVGFRPTMIYGAPSALKELCDHAREHGLPLPAVRTVFLSSELITGNLRRQLEQDLRCRVIGVYGSTEFKEVAWQCAAGRYHLNFESVYVENLPPDEQGGEPRLVITTLVNRAMPLIRFDIGDYARIGTDACACGRESPWLGYIAGRRVEHLELADGRRISPYLLTTRIETVAGLRQYQLVQHAGHVLELRVMFMPSHSERAASIDELSRILAELVGPQTGIRVTQVESIMRTAAGKHQVVARAS